MWAIFGGDEWVLRKRRLQATEVPAAMQHLAEMQEALSLWDNLPQHPLHADADVYLPDLLQDL